VVALGVLAACSAGGNPKPDGGADALAPADTGSDAAVDAPLSPDLAPDLMPDLKPDLMPDLGIPCGDGGECQGPLSCCGFCVDIHKDPRNCGACGTRCSTVQFCTGTACPELSFANVCSNPNVTVVKDPFETDNNAASLIGKALASSCMPPPTVVEKDQASPDVLDGDGRPLAGGSTSYISAGGAFGQHLIDYLDKAGITPLYITGDATNVGFRDRNGKDAISAPRPTLTDTHDFFLVQLSVEPVSGTLSIAAMGLFAPGTTAAGFWVSTEMVPKRASYPDAWYVFEWTDTGDKLPNAADTFTMVAHGK